MKRIARWLSLVLLVAVCLPTVQAKNINQVKSKHPDVRVAGHVNAPNFTLKDVDGQSMSLESLRGKVVLLNFWATWCPYCVDEMPAMEQLQREFKNQKVVILAINLEDPDTARTFMRQNAYTFTALVDSNNEVAELYQVKALPSVFIIDGDGALVTSFVGAVGKSRMRDAIASARDSKKSRSA
jgi:peroxiredoxin